MLAQSATSVAAQTWTGDTSTDWFTGTNWSGNSVPGQSGVVVVDTASPNAADVKQQLTNGPAVVESLTVGNVATATLSVLEGGEISVIGGSLIVGVDPGSDGTLVVSGSQTVDGKVAKSTLLVAGGFIIGNEGNGALTISEEGQVTGQLQIGALTGGSGTVMISGDGTAFSTGGSLFVGDQGNGNLAIEQGATATLTDASDALFIGNDLGGLGVLSMSGTGTVLTVAGDVHVGDQGSGALLVRTGSSVLSGGDDTDFFIGNATGSAGNMLVSGTGTIASVQGNLHVGYEGTGTLTIQSGASMTAGGDDALVHIGEEAGSSGKVSVSGGSEGGAGFSTVGELIVGDKGTGTLEIQSDGSVAVIGSDGNLEIGKDSGGTGTVLVSGTGASLVTDRSILVGEKGTGTLTVNNGGSISVEDGTGEIEVAADRGSNGTFIIGAPSGSDPVAPGEVLAGKILMFGGTSTLVFNHSATEAAPAEYSFELAAGFGPATISVEAGYTRYLGDGNPFLSNLVVDGGTFEVTNALAANDIIAGYDGTDAVLIVDEGAQVQLLGKLYIGDHAGSSGTVIVDGGLDGNTLLAVEQQQTNAAVPVVGYSGSGTLIVTNGAEFEAKNFGDRINLEVAKESGSTGLVVIGSPAGQTASAPGTLDVDEVNFGDGDGTLLFNHSDTSGDYEFERDIVKNGTILVEAGYTEYSGNGGSFSGTTSINGGTFAVTDKLTGTITVNDGGILAGTGSVSDTVTVNSGGSVAPGLSVGTLESGDITFEAGSELTIEIDSKGDADRLTSEKTVTLKGGTVDVTSDQYSDNATFTIVEGKDGISGTFDNVTGSTAFIDYTLSYDSDEVTLTQSVSQSFSSVATTGNQSAVARALDAMATENEVVQGLLGVGTEAEARRALGSLSGEIHASLQGVLMDENRRISNAVNRRLAASFPGPDATFAYGAPRKIREYGGVKFKSFRYVACG